MCAAATVYGRAIDPMGIAMAQENLSMRNVSLVGTGLAPTTTTTHINPRRARGVLAAAVREQNRMLPSSNPEVRAALALGTQAVQEVQAQAAEKERQAVEAALVAERERAAEAQKVREKEILERLSEIAEREQRAAVLEAIKETEERCAREASEWVKSQLPQYRSAPQRYVRGQQPYEQPATDHLQLKLMQMELRTVEQELARTHDESRAAIDEARSRATEQAVEATLLECEGTTGARPLRVPGRYL